VENDCSREAVDARLQEATDGAASGRAAG